MKIINFVQVTEAIATSGQPQANDFDIIASEGYSAIINLALATSDNAIPNEGELVAIKGMSYVHIPVEWEAPEAYQYALFSAIMNSLKESKVWVHCALNMRVSAFVYLYRTLELGVTHNEAVATMNKVWEPNEVWQRFISDIRNAA